MPKFIDSKSKILLFVVAAAAVVSIVFTYKHFVIDKSFDIYQSEEDSL